MIPVAILVYIIVVGLLAATAIVLGRRDIAAAQAERESPTPVDTGLRTLATPVADETPTGISDRIDYRMRRLMYQTGLDISAEVAVLWMILAGLALGGAIFLYEDSVVEGWIGFGIGAMIPLGYFWYARSSRMTQIREQLPDVVDLISRSVRAGESIDQAIGSVGTSFGAPLGVEFLRAAKQLDMGLSMNASMRALTHRAPMPEMRILASTFNVQRKAGGNVAANLDRLAQVIRDRLSYQRQFMAATGSSRMATILIALAGPFVFLYMMFVQPDYMGQFLVQPGGTTLLAIAAGLQVAGLMWVYGLLRNHY